MLRAIPYATASGDKAGVIVTRPAGSYPVGHFEFRSPHRPPRRNPVSENGYRNRFAPMPDIEAEASPQEYARLVALVFIRRAPVPAILNESREQPTPFSLLG